MNIMQLSAKASELLNQINLDLTKLGDLRKLAKTIKKDHGLALEMWSTNTFKPRLFAILIMDTKCLNQTIINQFCSDIEGHCTEEALQLMD